jgi:hypothetical protein
VTVAILVYATSAELAIWTGASAPSNAVALLRTASILVRRATRSAVYSTGSDGAPDDDDLADVFSDATCAHAAAMAAAVVDPLAAGTETVVASSSIGSASVSTLASPGAEAARLSLSTTLCPEATAILDDAGLIGQAPYVGRAATIDVCGDMP